MTLKAWTAQRARVKGSPRFFFDPLLTEDGLSRLWSCEHVYHDNKKQVDLMKFQIKQYLKANGIPTNNRYPEI